jgi:signal transduction histidine kinase
MNLYMGDEKKTKEYMEIATWNFNRLARLVGNLLDITKIDAGYLKANFVKTDIVSLIRDICDTVVSYARDRSIQLIYKTSLEEKIMLIDTEKIARILLNLLSNALKHTGKDGKITVSLAERKDGGVIISVEDTGEGIPEHKLNIIFDRFALVNASLVRQTEGCGMGLALVQSMVRMLNGSIRVKSKEGKGSKFIIELPLMDMDSQTKIIEMEGYDLKRKAAVELSDLELQNIYTG